MLTIAGPRKEWVSYENLPLATVFEWFDKFLDVGRYEQWKHSNKDEANFINQCIFDRAFQDKLGYQTIEWEFNSYVLHNPLNYLSHEPAGGPGYEIIPEDWKPPTYRMNKPVKSRENKDHCRECRCRDITQPDELIEAGNIWFDKKNFRLIKSLVEEEFERNQQIIKKDGFFSAVHMLAKVKSAVHMIAEVKLSYTALARV